MIIYIDTDCRCHVSNENGEYTPAETDFFDGKCDAFIEGYRYVPEGETWTRSDGVVFQGGMISPWKPWEELDMWQRGYEQELLRQYETALGEIEAALGVEV